MAAGPQMMGVVLALVVMSVVYTLVGAGILIASCRIVGTTTPKYSRACFVTMLSWLAYVVLSFIAGMVIAAVIYARTEADGSGRTVDGLNEFLVMQMMAQAMTVVAWALISGALFKLFIPLPAFGRAMLVWFVSFVIWLAILIVMWLVVAGFAMVGGAAA